MRTYEDEALRDDTLPQFARRYERPTETRGRTPLDILADALVMLHRDVGEYAFAGLIGAAGAAFLAIILSTGDFIGQALIAPAVFGVAIVTYANTCAAMRRAQDNLEPDAARAFFSVLARVHALFTPMMVPLALSALAVLAGVIASRWAPGSVLTLGVIVVFAYCGLAAFQRALYIPALFARNVTFSDARILGIETMKKASVLLGTCFIIALAPAWLMAMIGLVAGFGALSAGMTAFVFVACMPLAGAIAAIVYEGLAPQAVAASPARRQRRSLEEQAVEQRIVRRMR